MQTFLKQFDYISADPPVLHFGESAKKRNSKRFSASSVIGCISLLVIPVCLLYIYISILPLYSGSNNRFSSITSGANTTFNLDFKKPMSFESFGVMPVLTLSAEIGKSWIKFNDQSELERAQRVFTFGTVY